LQQPYLADNEMQMLLRKHGADKKLFIQAM